MTPFAILPKTQRNVEVIELSFPVDTDLVVLARLAATTVASWAGFDMEEIEDLRLAVDEVCVWLVRQAGHTGLLRLVFTRDDDSIEVLFTLDSKRSIRRRSGLSEDVDDLQTRFLEALVDAHARRTVSGQSTAWLRKRRVPSGV